MHRTVRLGVLFTLGLAALARTPGARAHILGNGLQRPQIEAEVRIAYDRVTADVHLPTALFLAEIAGGLSLDEFEALGEEERFARVASSWAERNPISIDGIVVLPRIDLVELQKPDTVDPTIPPDKAIEFGAVRVILVYETKGGPRQVGIVWRVFPATGDGSAAGFGADVVAIQLEAEERRKLLLFTPDEPEQIWHSSGAPQAPISFDVPAREGRASVAVPILAVLLGAVGVFTLRPWRRRGPSGGSRALGLVLLAGSVGLGFADPVRVVVPLPWQANLERPPPEQAIEIFRSLHKNIYRAFDYTRESEIYDTLAQSVDGAALEKIYSDIWESLVMRDQGGAVSRIQSVDVLEADVVDPGTVELAADAPPLDEEGFFVTCRWRVDGLVRHWGHTHRRTNEFRATYGVAPRHGSWKIIQTSVLHEKRLLSGSGG